MNRRLAEAQHVAQLAYWEIDSATGDVYWSDEMYRLAGLEVGIQPPPTDRFLQVVHPDDRERIQGIADGAIRDLSEFTEQYRLVPPDGPIRIVQSKGRLVVDDAHDRKLVGTVQDISDRVQLETQLLRSQKMDAIGQLAGGVAHDFNNMLTVIEGYTGLLLAGRPRDDADRPHIEEISGAARRAATLTRQLLAFSRQQVLQPRVLSVNDTVTGIEKMLVRLIGEHIEFFTNLDPEADPVNADPGQLEQVLMNLAVNARDAMNHGGVLTIETANVFLDAEFTKHHPSVRPGHYVSLAASRLGNRHRAGEPRPDLRAVLHYEREREGDRPRTVDGSRDRRAVGRPYHCHERDWARHDIPRLLATRREQRENRRCHDDPAHCPRRFGNDPPRRG